MRLGPPPEEPEVPGQFWIDFIRDTAPVFRKSTLEQISEFIAPTWQALIDGAKYVNPRLEEIIGEVEPDAIVEDNVVSFPAVMAAGRPWVRIVSCNPAELKDPLVAPFSSGYPADDRSAWPAFLAEYRRAHARDVGRLRRVLSRARGRWPCRRRARSRLHARVPVPQPVLVSRRGRLRAGEPARPDVASPRLDGPRRRDVLGPPSAPRGAPRRTHLPVAGQPRLGGCRADAAPRRPAGADRPPGDRVEGPARRPDHAPRQHDRRGLPAAARDPARSSTS